MEANMEEFEKELTILINKYSIENESDTPDYLLAKFLVKCLHAYGVTVLNRDEYYDEKHGGEWETGLIDK
jgi:hypothetical protein